MFEVLGVQVDLSRAGDSGIIVVRNKPSREDRALEIFEQLGVRGTVVPSVAESLRGMLQYAAGQTFGRCGQPGLCLLSRIAARGPVDFQDEEVQRALHCLEGVLQARGPAAGQGLGGGSAASDRLPGRLGGGREL